MQRKPIPARHRSALRCPVPSRLRGNPLATTAQAEQKPNIKNYPKRPRDAGTARPPRKLLPTCQLSFLKPVNRQNVWTRRRFWKASVHGTEIIFKSACELGVWWDYMSAKTSPVIRAAGKLINISIPATLWSFDTIFVSASYGSR